MSPPPIPPVLAPGLMLAFWALLGGAAGIKIMQGIWPVLGFGGGDVAIAIPVGGVAGALAGALLALIRNPHWLVLLMAVFAGSAAGAVAAKVPWGAFGECQVSEDSHSRAAGTFHRNGRSGRAAGTSIMT